MLNDLDDITPVIAREIEPDEEELKRIEDPIEHGKLRINSDNRYVAEDISFVNTHHFNEAARHYQKHGCYTLAPEGSRDFIDFWDREEYRRIHGMTAPGKLIVNEDGELTIQKVHITGEHYGFLNYAPIIRTVDSNASEISEIVKDFSFARKVGKKDVMFPDFFDGQYHYFKAKEFARAVGLNLVVGKARRKGYSYMESWDAADSVNMNPNMIVLLGAFDKTYLTKPGKLMPMTRRYLDWLEDETDWNRGYLTASKEIIELGYIPQGDTKPKGYRSTVMIASFKDNPDAAIGSDAYKIKLEECGRFPNLKEALKVTLSTIEAGDLITGQIIMFGTGGTKDTNWEDFEDIFYNPMRWNCLAFENIWDKESRGTGCGFYFPHRQNFEPYVDEWGNSLYDQADPAIEKERKKKKETSTTEAEYADFIGQRSNCPRESFNRGSDNIFWSQALEDHLHFVHFDPQVKYLARTGMVNPTDKGMVLDTRWKHEVLDEFPYKGTDPTGAVVEWFPPYTVNGVTPANLYSIWHDPYALDKDPKKVSSKDSLGAAYVYENVNNITPHRGDILAASYIGRPESIEDYNRNLFNLAVRYNAKIMFENDRGQVYSDAKMMKMLHTLAKEPDILWAKELQVKSKRNYGLTMNTNRKRHGALYVKQWLYTKVGTRHDGSPKYLFHYIYDVALLKELLKWHIDGNFDRVSALIVGMYHRKEMLLKKVQEAAPEANPESFFEKDLFV